MVEVEVSEVEDMEEEGVAVEEEGAGLVANLIMTTVRAEKEQKKEKKSGGEQMAHLSVMYVQVPRI